MEQVTIHQAKTQLSRLIQKALEGEEIIIAKGNRPVVRLQVLNREPGKRVLGRYPNLLRHMAPDFHETPEDFVDYTR